MTISRRTLIKNTLRVAPITVAAPLVLTSRKASAQPSISLSVLHTHVNNMNAVYGHNTGPGTSALAYGNATKSIFDIHQMILGAGMAQACVDATGHYMSSNPVPIITDPAVIATGNQALWAAGHNLPPDIAIGHEKAQVTLAQAQTVNSVVNWTTLSQQTINSAYFMNQMSLKYGLAQNGKPSLTNPSKSKLVLVDLATAAPNERPDPGQHYRDALQKAALLALGVGGLGVTTGLGLMSASGIDANTMWGIMAGAAATGSLVAATAPVWLWVAGYPRCRRLMFAAYWGVRAINQVMQDIEVPGVGSSGYQILSKTSTTLCDPDSSMTCY